MPLPTDKGLSKDLLSTYDFFADRAMGFLTGRVKGAPSTVASRFFCAALTAGTVPALSRARLAHAGPMEPQASANQSNRPGSVGSQSSRESRASTLPNPLLLQEIKYDIFFSDATRLKSLGNESILIHLSDLEGRPVRAHGNLAWQHIGRSAPEMSGSYRATKMLEQFGDMESTLIAAEAIPTFKENMLGGLRIRSRSPQYFISGVSIFSESNGEISLRLHLPEMKDGALAVSSSKKRLRPILTLPLTTLKTADHLGVPANDKSLDPTIELNFSFTDARGQTLEFLSKCEVRAYNIVAATDGNLTEFNVRGRPSLLISSLAKKITANIGVDILNADDKSPLAIADCLSSNSWATPTMLSLNTHLYPHSR